jgi:chromosome segregation ATPase
VKKTAYLDKNQADKSKLFPSRRVLINTLQRKKHKCVSLIQQNQELQEKNSLLEQKLQDDRSLHDSIRDDINACLEYIGFLQNELDRLRKKIQDPQGNITKLQSEVRSSEFKLMEKRALFEFQVDFLNSSDSEAVA